MKSHYDEQAANVKADENAKQAALVEHENKRKALQAYHDATVACVDKVFSIIKAFFSSIANVADILARYAGLTGVLASGINLLSIAPAIVISPIGAIFQLVLALANHDVSLATKLVHFFTGAGSSGASIASAIFSKVTSTVLHSFALPLIIVSASLGLVKAIWDINDLYKRQEKGATVTSMQEFDAWQGFAISIISVLASFTLFVCPPLSYALFGAIALYKLADSLGYNPIKMLFNMYENDKQEKVAIESASTTKITYTLTNALEEKAAQKIKNDILHDPVAEKALEENKAKEQIKQAQEACVSTTPAAFYNHPNTPCADASSARNTLAMPG